MLSDKTTSNLHCESQREEFFRFLFFETMTFLFPGLYLEA